MDKDEALKLALEALDCICSPLHVREITKVGNAMKAIKEALAQPEQESDDLTIAYMSGFHDGKNKDAPQRKPDQEPVAWMREDEDCTDCIVWEQTEEHTIPLYTTPPKREWVGLTEKERDHFEGLHLYAARNQVEAWIEGVPAFIDAIEAKLREKNTYTSPPQRKPLPPQSPCEMTQAEGKMFKLGWLECEAAHGIKGE